MKRWTATWAAMVFAGFLAVPAIGFAQTATTPAASAMTTAPEQSNAGSPEEHLQKADAALKGITPASVSGSATAQIAQLRNHVEAMQRLAANPRPAASANARSTTTWASEAAAADKIIGQLLAVEPVTGAAGASSPTEPKPVGTSGVTPSRARTSVSLDDETRARLTSVRSHLTAFAVAMSGTAGSAKEATPPSATSPAPTSASATPSASTTTTTPTQAAAGPGAQSPAQPANPTAPADPSAPEVQPPAAGATAPATPAAPAGVDAEGAKRALTSARDALSQMTQLPAAAQLAGENRTQVAQLISNFNELITTSAEWKAAYAKVDSNVTALIGAEVPGEGAPAGTAQPSAAAPPPNAAPEAVGTSGTATPASSLDPALKAKLVEFRTHLKAFEKAAGGVQQ